MSVGIKQVYCNSLEEAANIVFREKGYDFHHHPELIDIEKRFRIFSFEDLTYVAKKGKSQKLYSEYSKARAISERLSKQTIGDFRIFIEVPKHVALTSNEDDGVLVSKYHGKTLLSNLYSADLQVDFSLSNLEQLVDIFLLNGIEYRGLLPRNIIVQEKLIVIIDLEDAVILEASKLGSFNQLWETNFILNWSYFFPQYYLDKIVSKRFQYSAPLPPLVSYESSFAEMCNWQGDNVQLRKLIFKVVLLAEGRSYESISNSICPNDLAHLVSDIYDYDIDVLFDIACYNFRKGYEKNFPAFLIISQKVLKNYFNNSIPINVIQSQYMVIILMIISPLNTISHFNHLSSLNNPRDIFMFVEKKCISTPIIEKYLANDDINLYDECAIQIKKSIKCLNAGSCNALWLDRVCNRILELSKKYSSPSDDK